MTETPYNNERLFLLPNKGWLRIALFILLMALGLGVRLLDLTDLPLDFASTRQLHSLILTRGYYYRMDTPDTTSMQGDLRDFGINAAKGEPVIEPPIMELLTAFTYRFTGRENIIIPRLYSILFWLLGGAALYLAMKQLTSISGAFIGLAIYLFTPFAVFASRAFQPDPLMVCAICWAWYFQIRWGRQDNWKTAILAGVFTGLAVLVKALAVFFVGIPILALVLSKGFRQWVKNPRVYVMAFLSILPGLAYNLWSATAGGNAGAIFGSRFFPNLFTQLVFYAGWSTLIRGAVGFGMFLVGLLGVFLLKNKTDRIYFASIWLGYFLFGLTVAYHISTHNYYHLPLVPIAAIGVGVVAGVLIRELEKVDHQRVAAVLLWLTLLFSIVVNINEVRGSLYAEDYRPEKTFWYDLGKKIGYNAKVIGLLQDYGGRLNYWGYVNPKLWATTGDQRLHDLSGASNPAFEDLFEIETEGRDYFLVTMMNDFEAQPALQEYLFTHYAVDAGDGYYLFDLHHPLQ